jgi:hypothetical protein
MVTVDQVAALAPDAASAAAGRKLSSAGHWKNLGHDDVALWGDCQGSALYGVSVDLSDLTCRCTCPSRKFPCKHGLGLLLLYANGGVPAGSPPERTTTWLAGREARATKKAEAAPPTEAQITKRAARAEAKLDALGPALAAFALWLDDVARAGLASLERDGAKQLEREAARLVDVGAPGLASRCRDLAEEIGARDGWEAVVLAGLGTLRLLVTAVERSDQLSEGLRLDLRAAVGVTTTQDEVRLTGRRDEGRWWVGGAVVRVDANGMKTRRTWLLRDGDPASHALVLDFGPGPVPLPPGLPLGEVLDATLIRWPGAGQRALIADKASRAEVAGPPAGQSVADALSEAAAAFAALPWLRVAPLLLADVTVGRDGDAWWLRDPSGDGLPLVGFPDALLALVGSDPFTVCVEWDGATATPITAWVDGVASPLPSTAPPARAPALRELARLALVGGDGPLPATPVDSVVPAGTRPQRLLWLAGALDAWARAGARPGRPSPLPACPPETTPAAPAGVRALMDLLGDTPSHPLLGELYRRLAALGLRLPHAVLARVLDATHHRGLVPPLLGERGRWLARLRPSWAWAIAAEDPDDIEALSQPAQRREALAALRAVDPARAREVLTRLLATEKADRRAELLADLTPVADDLPLLRAAAADRSQAVAKIADDHRLSLGEDPHAEAVAARLGVAVTVRDRRAVVLVLPPAADPTWVTSGLPALPATPGKPTTGMDRLRWLLRRVPPASLASRLGLSPEVFVAGFPADAIEALESIAEAAIRVGDVVWIEALLAAPWPRADVRAGLLRALPLERQHALLLSLGSGPEVVAELIRTPGPWSRAVTELAVRLAAEMPEKQRWNVHLIGDALAASCADADLDLVTPLLDRLPPAPVRTLDARRMLVALLGPR